VESSSIPHIAEDDCTRQDLALGRAFAVLGKRWTGMVLRSLRPGPAGFREISRAIDGVSDSMLSDRLAELTAAGLVARTVEEGPPVTVSYALTASGAALLPALAELSVWAEKHLPGGARAC
jgi:DNA-binding HxlR family transcriptional regulator